LIGASFVAAFDIYQKFLVDGDYSPLQLAVQTHLVALVPLILLLALFPLTFSPQLLVLVIATGLVNGFGFWMLAVAYREDAISLIAPLRGITPIAVAFVEPLFFSNFSYQLSLLAASIIVAVGMYILLYEDSPWQTVSRIHKPGVKHGVACALFFAIAVLIDRYALVTTGVHPVTYSTYLIGSTLVVTICLSV